MAGDGYSLIGGIGQYEHVRRIGVTRDANVGVGIRAREQRTLPFVIDETSSWPESLQPDA